MGHLGPNLHTVYMYGGTLCIRCKSCDHRAAFDKTTYRHIHEGNMTQLRELKFRCRKCAGTDVEKIIPFNLNEAKRFLAGEQIVNHGNDQ